MIFCDRCGAELNPSAKFCSRCGNVLRQSSMLRPSRSGHHTEVVQPRMRSRAPRFVSMILRPREEVLGCFPCLMRTSGRKARSELWTVILATDRLILARRMMFSHNVEETPYAV